MHRDAVVCSTPTTQQIPRLLLSPKLSRAPPPNRAPRAAIAFPESNRPVGGEPTMPMPRLQQPRQPRGRDRTVIDELCARHNRPRPTNDRQLARPRSPQDDRQERTRGRHPPSHSDWRCGKRVNPPAVGPPEASSVALTSRLGQRPSVFRVPLLLGGRPIGSRRPLPRRAPAHSAMHDARRGRQRTGACSSPASVGWTRSCATSPKRSSGRAAPIRESNRCGSLVTVVLPGCAAAGEGV